MSDLTELVFGLILWLVSCSFIFNVYSNQSKIQAQSNYKISPSPFNENEKLVNQISVNKMIEKEQLETNIKTEINEEKIKQIKQELADKITELELAKKNIESLKETLEFKSNQLDLIEKEKEQIEIKLSEDSHNFENKISDLEQQYEELKQDLDRQTVELNFDFQANVFEQLHSLLTSYPTAKVMIKIKPNLPASNLIALFKPLDNLLQSWDVIQIGQPWQQIPYNPQLHQPDNQDMVEGELVYVRFIGYMQEDRILYPAKVSRTLPGKS